MTDRRAFIKKSCAGAVSLAVLSLFSACRDGEIPNPASMTPSLPRSTPEAQGISSTAISGFLNATEQSGLEFHGFMLVKNGFVVAEGWWSPFQAEFKHSLYSLSKSFTSTAVGLAVADEKLSIDEPVISFFPEDLPGNVSENLKAMKVRHLLTMTTGHAEDTFVKLKRAPDQNWVKAFLGLKVEYKPGTHFLYNTGATYMLSAIVQKVTNKTIHAYLSERLFKPLNIEDTDWEACPKGISVGGIGLSMRTEDMAKFGQLYLQKGKWNGQQIIPASWIEAATKKQTESFKGDNDWTQGYGYQFWRCKPEPGFYRGDGAFGQFCIIIPQRETVIAINSESPDMQASMDLVWEYLLPALEPGKALPEDPVNHEILTTQITQLALPVLSILPDSPKEKEISGKTFLLNNNDWEIQSVSFLFENHQCLIKLSGEKSMQQLNCGKEKWIIAGNDKKEPEALFAIPDKTDVLSKVAASYTWKDEETLLIRLKFVENIHGDQWTCTFQGDQISIAFDISKPLFDPGIMDRKELTGFLVKH